MSKKASKRSSWERNYDFKRTEFGQYLSDLDVHLNEAMAAVKRLHKVTGKAGCFNMLPLTEPRWSDTCWDDYAIVAQLAAMLQRGQTVREMDQEILGLK